MNAVKFTPDTYKNCVASNDFYKAIGLMDTIKAGKIRSVYQMKINPNTYKSIEAQMQSNWCRIRLTRCMGKVNALKAIVFDWMNYSPVQDDTVPENEIWWEEKSNGS